LGLWVGGVGALEDIRKKGIRKWKRNCESGTTAEGEDGHVWESAALEKVEGDVYSSMAGKSTDRRGAPGRYILTPPVVTSAAADRTPAGTTRVNG
jgi:hypothetical protein